MDERVKKRKRIVNFRFFLFVAVSIILAIFFAWLFIPFKALSVILFITFVIALILLFIISFIKKKNPVFLTAIIAAIILSISTYATFIYQVNHWNASDFSSGRVYAVSGSLDSNVVKYGQRIIVINHITLDGNPTTGKLRLYVSETSGSLEFAKEGDKLSFSAKVVGTDIMRNYAKNQRYYSSAKQNEISFELGTPSFFQSIRIKIRNILHLNMGEDIAEISYSMLTGDKNNLPLDTVDYFRASGIAHILAVSGLHINFLIMLLMLPLKKLRLNKWLKISFVELVLLFYGCIADFSPSVTRAIIMSSILLLTTLLGKERDSLNNLCCAVCLMLLIRPLLLFDTGFLLSVSAVFGVILFYHSLTDAFTKIKIPKKLAEIIALVLSAQIGLFPVSIYYFLFFTPYSLLTNVILCYVIMLSFMILVIGTLAAYIIPSLGFILKASEFGIEIIDKTAQIVASLPYARIALFTLLPIFLWYILYFIISRFTRKEVYYSRVVISCLMIMAVMLVWFNIPYDIKNTITPVSTPLYDVTSIVTVENKVYLIGDVNSSLDASKALVSIKARKLDAVFVSRMNAETAEELINLGRRYKGFTVYFPLTSGVSGLNLLVDDFEIRGFEDSCEIINSIHGEFYNGRFICYRLKSDVTALFIPLNVSLSSIPSSLIAEAAIIRAFEDSHPYSGISLTNVKANSGLYPDNMLPMYESKSLIFNYKTNKQRLVRR